MICLLFYSILLHYFACLVRNYFFCFIFFNILKRALLFFFTKMSKIKNHVFFEKKTKKHEKMESGIPYKHVLGKSTVKFWLLIWKRQSPGFLGSKSGLGLRYCPDRQKRVFFTFFDFFLIFFFWFLSFFFIKK